MMSRWTVSFILSALLLSIAVGFNRNVFAAPPSAKKPEYVSIDEAAKQIDAHKIKIKALWDELDSHYGRYHAKESLTKAMNEQGVQYSLRHVESWSNWIYSDTTHIDRLFYTRHNNNLRKSWLSINLAHPATKADMIYLRNGMKRFENIHKGVLGCLHERNKSEALRGKLLDEMWHIKTQRSNAVSETQKNYWTRELQRVEQKENERVIKNKMNSELLDMLVAMTAFSALDAKERVPVPEPEPECKDVPRKDLPDFEGLIDALEQQSNRRFEQTFPLPPEDGSNKQEAGQ